MRVLAIALAAFATLGLALPAASTAEAASVKKFIIKSGHPHHARHWRHAPVKHMFIAKPRHRHHY